MGPLMVVATPGTAPGVRPEAPAGGAGDTVPLPLLLQNARRLEGAAADAAAVVAGDFDVKLFAEAGEGADLVEQVALGLGQRLQSHRLAAARSKGWMALKSRVVTLVGSLGLRKLKTVWLEKLSSSRRRWAESC